MRRTLGAAVLAAALLAGGCGGGGGGDDAGMTHFTHGALAVDYPQGWKRHQDKEGHGGLVLFATGTSGVDGVDYRITVFDQAREAFKTAKAYGKSASDTRAFDLHGRVIADGPTEVPGSEGAWRVATDYRVNPSTGGPPKPARLIDIMPLKGDRQYRLSLSGPRKDMGSAQIRKIIDSFTLDASS